MTNPTPEEVDRLIAQLQDWRGGPDSEFHLRTDAANALEALSSEREDWRLEFESQKADIEYLRAALSTQPEALVTEQWGLWNRNAGQWYPDESARVVHEIVPTSRLAKREARTTYGPWEEVTE